GNPWPGITKDIDGDTRSSTTPCIGADEFTTVGSPMSGTYYIKLGTSAADTFPSFEKANADLAVRGQVGNVTFVVFGGIYKENIDLTGLENGPYWVNYIARTSGSPPQPDEVYLQATGSYGITLRGNKRVRFRNLNLVGWTSYGFYLYYKSTTTGGGCDTIVIDGCKVSGGSYPIYAYNYYGGSDDSIMGCELRSTSSYGIYLYGSSSYQNQRNFIANNIITGWTSYGIYAYYQYYPKFIYNTILGTGSYAVYNYYPYGDTWKNNILQAQSYAIYRYYGDNVPAYSNYNCFWLNGGSSSSLVIYSYAYGAQTLAQWQSSSGKDGNSIQLDPLTGGVINPHLRTGSPCINAGNPWPGITKDIDGDTRSSTTPCIGADEYTTVGSPMSGVYTIKQAGGGDFKNFQEAFGQLALRGFGGNVQFDAYDGNYFGMLNFNGIGNGANRLYVRAYPGQNVVVTAGSSYGIYLYNNQRIRIEGITFTGYTSYGCYATSYYTNQNTTDSCAIVGNTFNGASGMYLSYCDWDTIANNTINATSSYGIYIYGYSGAPYSLNNVISGNTITGWTSYGIMAYYQDSLKIIGNTIKSTGSYGIYPNYCNRTRIIGNIIDAGSIAIYEYAGSTTYGNQEVIANNLARGASYGLYTYYLTGAKIINNSFHGSFAWYDYYSYTTTYPESVYNNIFRGMSYAWYKYYGDNVPTGMDYNCFYMGSVGGSIIYHSTYGTLTLTGWRSASGRDANSLDADPLFVSELAPYDLHIQGSSPCKDTSYVFPPFTTDVDGDTRGAPGKKSDIGGDEFYIDIAAASIISPASLIPVGATIQPSAVFKHMGGPRATFYTKMVIRRGATPAYTDSVQVTVNPGDSVIATFANWTPNIVASNYSATAFHLISGDAHPSDDTIVKNFAVGNVDAGMVAILAPPDQAPLGGTIYPQVVVRNYGDFEASCNVRFTITDPTDGDLNSGEVPTDEAAPRLVRKVRLDATVYDTTETVVLAVGAQETLTFTKPWNPAVTGNHSAACRVSLLYDTDPTNDYLSKPFTVERFDFGVTQVVAPTGNVTQNTPVAPSLKIKNYGSSTASCGARVIVLSGTTPVYDQTETGISIPAGGEVTRTFATPWNAAQLGPFTVTAYTLHDYDIDPTNDTAYGSGTVVPSGGGTGNWTCESQMPSGAKPIGDGGWLAYA
ncbi:MAG: right-handed parallel beta-helix repeat-containing protein, partial [candidate division WOR-3 bacterium]